jgi:Uncharacterized conserved protein
MNRLFELPAARARDPAIDAWWLAHPGELGAIARRWFDVMRGCGDDVRELLHDRQPTACVGVAAFGYVDVFTRHVDIGFYRGAEIADPARLLRGTGRYMRHVKLGPGRHVADDALAQLIATAYADMKKRLPGGQPGQGRRT